MSILGGYAAYKSYKIAKKQYELQKKAEEERVLDEARRVHEASQRANLAGFSDAFGQAFDTAESDLSKVALERQRGIEADASRKRGAAVQARGAASPSIAQYIANQRAGLMGASQIPGSAYTQYSAGATSGMPDQFRQAVAQKDLARTADMGQRADLVSALAGTRAMDAQTQKMGDIIDVATTGEKAMGAAAEGDYGIASGMLGDQRTATQGVIDRQKNVLDRKYGTIGASVRQGVNQANPWKAVSQIYNIFKK